MITVEVDDINELLYEACNNVMMHGEKVTVRGMKTKELHPFHATINNPTKRTLMYPYRGNNPFGTMFETIWVLGAKDNNIDELVKYLPRAVDYSDDGHRWRAGYPERLRVYGGSRVDQLEYVYEKLKSDQASRQAVVNLWNPELDDFENGVLKESADFSCSQNLTFVIRDGKLDCTFYIRSNDAIFGCTAINLYEFTVIQELLAGALGVEIGTFYYYINSLHIYEDKYDKAKTIIQEGKPYADYLRCVSTNAVTQHSIPVFNWYDDIDTDYGCIMSNFETLYQHLTEENHTLMPIGDTYDDIFHLCKIYQKYKDEKYSIDTWVEYMEDMKKVRYTDLKVACHFWMGKNLKCFNRDGIEVAIQQMKLQEEGK